MALLTHSNSLSHLKVVLCVFVLFYKIVSYLSADAEADSPLYIKGTKRKVKN